LERYLELRPDAPDREEVEKRISNMRAAPATVVVSSDPPGASVIIDGAGTGKVTPAEIEVEAGEHTVGISLEGYSRVTEKLTVDPGARRELSLTLLAGSEDDSTSSSGADSYDGLGPEQESRKGANLAPWIVTGAGVLVLGTGAVLGGLVLGVKSDFDKKPTKAKADKGERLALLADVAFGVGAAAVITGVVLFLTTGGDAVEKEGSPSVEGAEQGARLRVTPLLSASYAGIATQLQF
jgi:hypothetical protein